MNKHILVTNDDGVTAPGLLALVQEMRLLGKVSVLAPDHNWSAGGHVKTLERALRVREVRLADGTRAYASDGAPSDCVALGTLGYFKEPVDLVVSGINNGANFGHDVTYSGTVTAAMEAVIAGVPGVAVSLDIPEGHIDEIDYGPAARAARLIVEHVIEEGLPGEILLNVNVPFLKDGQIQGFRFTRQGLRVYHSRLDERTDPRSPLLLDRRGRPDRRTRARHGYRRAERRLYLGHPFAARPDCLSRADGIEFLELAGEGAQEPIPTACVLVA